MLKPLLILALAFVPTIFSRAAAQVGSTGGMMRARELAGLKGCPSKAEGLQRLVGRLSD